MQCIVESTSGRWFGKEAREMQYVFVYGTLRPGGANYGLLERATVAEQVAVADGLALYHNEWNTYPYAAPAAGRKLAGTLCTIPDRSWPDLRRRLDLLE